MACRVLYHVYFIFCLSARLSGLHNWAHFVGFVRSEFYSARVYAVSLCHPSSAYSLVDPIVGLSGSGQM
jgi:hypothetical protein